MKSTTTHRDNRSHTARTRCANPLVIVAVTLLTVGCGEAEQIAIYQAPKEPPPPTTVSAAGSNESTATAETPPTPPAPRAYTTEVKWTLPEGWTEVTDDQGRSTLSSGKKADDIDVRVSSFPGDVGGLVFNINRWRQQVGLPPVDQTQLRSFVRPMTDSQSAGIIVDLLGPPPAYAVEQRDRMIVAWIMADGQSWFFKTMGGETAIGKHEETLMNLTKSIRREFSIGPMTGVVPALWQIDPRPRPMRLMTLAALGGSTEDGPSTEIAFTRFPGDVGGELENINRWRRQIALGPVDAVEKQESRDMTIGGVKSKVYDMTGPAPAEGQPAPRTVVASVPHDGMMWFVKMSGPSGDLESEIDAFNTMLGSIDFAAEQDKDGSSAAARPDAGN